MLVSQGKKRASLLAPAISESSWKPSASCPSAANGGAEGNSCVSLAYRGVVGSRKTCCEWMNKGVETGADAPKAAATGVGIFLFFFLFIFLCKNLFSYRAEVQRADSSRNNLIQWQEPDGGTGTESRRASAGSEC